VTADSIKIGVTYPDLEAIRQFVDLDQGDYEAAYQALIDDINESGGINGRMVEAVFAPVSPVGTDAAAAACVKLTEDEQVFAVVGFFQNDATLCYTEAHQTAVVGGVMTNERYERAAAPWFTTEEGEDSQVDAVKALADAGELDGKVGVFSTITNEQLLNEAILPLLEELDITPVDSGVLDAPQDDAAAQLQGTSVIAERFRSQGVDQILTVGDSALPLLNGLATTDYRPELRFDSKIAIDAYINGGAADFSLLDGSVLGATDHEQFDEAGMQDCIAVLEAAGITDITDPADLEDGDVQGFVSTSSACRNMGLFTAIAEAAGPDLNYGTFTAAGEALGEISLPGASATYTYGPFPARDGDQPMVVWVFDPTIENFAVDEK
jgi:hypothetical protein